MTREEIIALVTEAVRAAMAGTPSEPVVDPEPVYDGQPDPAGPFAAGASGMFLVYQWLWFVNDFAASIGNRFTRSDIYTMMAQAVAIGIDNQAQWTVGSVPSWRFAKEAYQTRASELIGDKMTTEIEVFKSTTQALSDIDYGVTENLLNKLDLVLRRLSGSFSECSTDRDLGPNGELLTTGECVRLGYNFLDVITDFKLVPDTADSNFMKVRKELYDQYRAMGEGSFGPFTRLGTPAPWSGG